MFFHLFSHPFISPWSAGCVSCPTGQGEAVKGAFLWQDVASPSPWQGSARSTRFLKFFQAWIDQ